MKIDMITFHFAHNNGALLQCYGLYKYLEKLGYSVEIIDYRPPYHESLFVKNPNPFVLAHRAFLEYSDRNMLYRLYRYCKRVVSVVLHYNNKENVEKAIQCARWDEFLNKHFCLTSKYKSVKELQKNPPSADLYISGSDQLWNPYLTGYQPDAAYYLCFGNHNVTKITYAISACMLDVEKYSSVLKDFCSQLDGISLREEEKKADLEKCIGKEIDICPDPTFLLDTEDYYSIFNNVCVSEKDYMLVYLMQDKQNDEKNIELVEKLAEKLNVKLVDISMFRREWRVDVKEKNGVFVDEYLAYINGAKYIITNSFHCTVFSVNFHKQFVTLPIAGKSSRTSELLRLLNMQERMVTDIDSAMVAMLNIINYQKSDQHRKTIQMKGRKYLNNFLKVVPKGK